MALVLDPSHFDLVVAFNKLCNINVPSTPIRDILVRDPHVFFEIYKYTYGRYENLQTIVFDREQTT